MLTDIFATRYATVPTWQSFGEAERRLLVQAFRIVPDQLFPYYDGDGKERTGAKATWKSMHDRLTMELGLQELGPLGYWQTMNVLGNNQNYWRHVDFVTVCKNFVCGTYNAAVPADQFIKERLSFVEIAFRDRENSVATINALLPGRIAQEELDAKMHPNRARIPGKPGEGTRAFNAQLNRLFRAAVHELNERFRQAGTKLNYHNGFIQVSDDALVESQVEAPFWTLVSGPKWKNVDTDMKEAIDLRDSGGRNPAFFAARALESAMTIISDEKKWSHGGEKGAANYIDNLASKKNGFIEQWEGEALKGIFSHVRNELGHGPGGKPMPELSKPQTNWAIESCMSWTKNLIQRL